MFFAAMYAANNGHYLFSGSEGQFPAFFALLVALPLVGFLICYPASQDGRLHLSWVTLSFILSAFWLLALPLVLVSPFTDSLIPSSGWFIAGSTEVAERYVDPRDERGRRLVDGRFTSDHLAMHHEKTSALDAHHRLNFVSIIGPGIEPIVTTKPGSMVNVYPTLLRADAVRDVEVAEVRYQALHRHVRRRVDGIAVRRPSVDLERARLARTLRRRSDLAAFDAAVREKCEFDYDPTFTLYHANAPPKRRGRLQCWFPYPVIVPLACDEQSRNIDAIDDRFVYGAPPQDAGSLPDVHR